ncbi:MAG: phospholipase D-like domain-containing protein [Spirulinaceae cyanobacterium]
MRVRRLFLLLPLALIAFLFFLRSCPKQEEVKSDRPPPLPQDTFIQAYFNHNQAQVANYQEPYRKITRPGDNLEQVIIDTINSAQSSIDIAVQELRLPGVARSLYEKHQAGVQVRVIIENSYNRPWSDLTPAEVTKLEPRERGSYQEFVALVDQNQDKKLSNEEINQGDALVMLRNAGVPLIDDTADGSEGSDLMHHKFVVVDGQTVVTGSANFTTSGIHGDFSNPDSRGNANNLLKINNPQLAQIFTQEFNLMWGDGPAGKPDSKFGLQKPPRPPQQVTIGNTKVTVQFSPTSPSQPWQSSSNGLIAKTLASSTESVNLALFVFTEQQLVNVLETRHKQGVEVSSLIDPSFAFRNYSEGLDMLGIALSQKCQYEANNRPWQTPIADVGVPQLAEGDKLHHKMAVIDGKNVITGSHNWSAAANHNNDETVLILENPVIAAHFSREFERLYAPAILGIPVKLQEKIKAEEEACSQITTVSSPNAVSGLVNLNTATQKELETLPGIGPALAQRIIATRQEQPFTSLEDLQRVSGIGPSSQQKLDGRVSW